MFCTKFDTKKCFKKDKDIKKMTKACSKFVFKVDKVPLHVFQKGIDLSKMPRTHIMCLMSLLESELRLRPQGLHLGAEHHYDTGTFDVQTFLISSPKQDDLSYAIGIKHKPRKNTIVSFAIPKKYFLDSNKEHLKRIWPLVESILIHIPNKRYRRIRLRKIFKKLTKRDIEVMFRENKIRIKVRGRKVNDIIADVLKRI